MRVEFGNPAPTGRYADGSTVPGPIVTFCGPLPDDEEYGYAPHEDARTLAMNLALHMATAPVQRFGDVSDGTGHHEAFSTAVQSFRAESNGTPTWVWSDDEDFAVLLGAFFNCPVGRPADLEATHYTLTGPPGVGSDDDPEVDR
jgi:hypothetical protein